MLKCHHSLEHLLHFVIPVQLSPAVGSPILAAFSGCENNIMLVVTGGAGFIGSNLVSALLQSGNKVVVCDWLGNGQKWLNIAKSPITDFVFPEDLATWLDDHAKSVAGIFHMGAISATTEADGDEIVRKNLHFSNSLWRWCAQNRTPFIYASSAATYGNGMLGFDDDESLSALTQLRPLNVYGWSKAQFDINAVRMAEQGFAPPQWAGLKFFNVYGPNEYHKGSMRSVALQLYEKIEKGEPVKLFRSAHPDYPDGGQMRDFVWVADCVDVMQWLYEKGDVSGIFNCGSGKARSFKELADAAYKASQAPQNIEWVDTPANIARHYQYFTQANMAKLRRAGYSGNGVSLEEGVNRFIRDFLMTDDKYR